MTIRKALPKDLPRINDLLHQVHDVHSAGRPDIFNKGNKKYNDAEILSIISDNNTPVFVAVDNLDVVYGYCFCIIEEVKNNPSLVDMKSLYIDDLCVDENCRGKHVGTLLYDYVIDYATKIGCYHVTLNVWCINEPAMQFYLKRGLKPLKIVMEKVLEKD